MKRKLRPTTGKNKARVLLDSLASLLYSLFVMRANDAVQTALRRLRHEKQEVRKLSKETERLSKAYNQYLDVQNQYRDRLKSIEKLKALLGSYILLPQGVEDQSDLDESTLINTARNNLELWEAVQQYLRLVQEARMNEILAFLSEVQIKATRQAVEACLKAKPKVFSTRKKNREKFISLKEKY